MTIRTRIAPSPTGDPHVGTAYIALFNKCLAKQAGGEFILRIEDTDQARSTAQSEQKILDSLRWLGLDWDEGPGIGGEYGPYRQSERSEIYRTHVDQLLEQGHAFHCFCTSERLGELRKQQMADKTQPGYDGHCLKLTQQQVSEKLEAGEQQVIRMRVPEEGSCQFTDLLRGDIEIEWKQIDMQILVKADGLPTYHLANVVDDHLMKITHVVRGEEWINSVPKHLLLYKYFGWDAPVMCHMPLLRNPDKSKLSKRKNPTSIVYYERMGFLPEALINYLGMMGWTMPNGEEKFTQQQMIESFDISRVSLGGPVFDVEKLSWLNARYLREDFTPQQFIQLLADWAFKPEYIESLIPLIQERVEVMSDVVGKGAFFFSGMPEITEASFEHKKLDADQCRKILQFGLWRLEQVEAWDKATIMEALSQLAESMELKIRELLFPYFIAIAGTAASTSVLDSMAILGSDMSYARLRHAINVLGGVSKKEQKRWDSEYRKLSSSNS